MSGPAPSPTISSPLRPTPAGGILATANARITPDSYAFPITLDWAAPYRNERIWHILSGRRGLTPADMLRLQNDVYSDSDALIAHRLAYAIDHTPNAVHRLRLAADLLRSWNGEVLANTAAPAITAAARSALWTLLLTPKLSSANTSTDSSGAPVAATSRSRWSPPSWPASHGLLPQRKASIADDPASLYSWGERDFAEEQLIAHLPARWLPPTYDNWDTLLTTAVDKGLLDAKAPRDLSSWRYGRDQPTQIELALFAQSAVLRQLIGLRTGTPAIALPGNGNTVRQTHRNFGPSERLTVDLADPAAATLNLPLGESGNLASPFFLDQFPAYLHGTALTLPFANSLASSRVLILLPH